jgi:hydroxymethylbilane synthase
MASLRAVRPDLVIESIRGNVDTRLRKLDEGQFDAIVLACAGLVRLGLLARATEILSPELSLPAVGQGALGLECRAEDATTRARLAPLHDLETAICVAAERGVLVALGGDCKTPLGAYAERSGDSIHLRAFVAGPDGSAPRRVDRRDGWPANEDAARELGLATGQALR